MKIIWFIRANSVLTHLSTWTIIPLGAHVTWILSWSGWQFPSSPIVQHDEQTGATVISASVVEATGDVDVVGAIVEVTTAVDVVLVGGVVDDLYDELVVVVADVVVATDVVADVVVAENATRQFEQTKWYSSK